MNLAFKDVKYNFLRFLLTTAGVGFLIMASTGMVGLYRGIVGDALLVVDKIGADLWVVQGGRALLRKLCRFSKHGPARRGYRRRICGPALCSDQSAIQLRRT